MLKKCLIFFWVLTGSMLSANAVEDITLKKVRVGLFLSPPFVMTSAYGEYEGMAIDLWKLATEPLSLLTDYQEYNSLDQVIKALQNEEIDFIVTNLTVTYDRAQLMKFSFPWYDGGLRILINSDRKGSVWNEMKQNGQLHSYLWIIPLILIITFLLTLLYRRADPEFPRRWRDGLSLNLYNLMVAIQTGSLETRIFGWIGHILAVFWMVFGIGLVAYVTSTITSSMTKVSLTSDINSLADLSDKLIGVEEGGIEENYLSSLGLHTVPYNNVMDASEGLLNKEISAVVSDAPVLEYWVHINPEKKLKVTGNLFHPDKYAFAANKSHSGLMDSISTQLIKLYDTGRINRIKESYLGASEE